MVDYLARTRKATPQLLEQGETPLAAIGLQRPGQMRSTTRTVTTAGLAGMAVDALLRRRRRAGNGDPDAAPDRPETPPTLEVPWPKGSGMIGVLTERRLVFLTQSAFGKPKAVGFEIPADSIAGISCEEGKVATVRVAEIQLTLRDGSIVEAEAAVPKSVRPQFEEFVARITALVA